MAEKVYKVVAFWDEEAKCWVASSEDVPGLATGAATVEELLAKLRVMVPELLDANGMTPADSSGPIDIPIDLITRERVRLRA